MSSMSRIPIEISRTTTPTLILNYDIVGKVVSGTLITAKKKKKLLLMSVTGLYKLLEIFRLCGTSLIGWDLLYEMR